MELPKQKKSAASGLRKSKMAAARAPRLSKAEKNEIERDVTRLSALGFNESEVRQAIMESKMESNNGDSSSKQTATASPEDVDYNVGEDMD